MAITLNGETKYEVGDIADMEVAVDPASGHTQGFVAVKPWCAGSPYGSIRSGTNCGSPMGGSVYRADMTAGTAWTKLNLDKVLVSDLDIFPGDPKRIVVGASNYFDWSGGGYIDGLQTGVFITVDGTTFTNLANEPLNAKYVEYHPTDSNKVYVGIAGGGIQEVQFDKL